MKSVIFIWTLFFSISVWAADEAMPQPFDVPDTLGTFHMDFKDIGEPSYSPFEMTLTVECKNKKKLITVINKESISGFNEHAHDEKTHTLLIIYRTVDVMNVGDVNEIKWAQAWKLKDICGK
jgi:hypothetical protein